MYYQKGHGKTSVDFCRFEEMHEMCQISNGRKETKEKNKEEKVFDRISFRFVQKKKKQP